MRSLGQRVASLRDQTVIDFYVTTDYLTVGGYCIISYACMWMCKGKHCSKVGLIQPTFSCHSDYQRRVVP